MGWRTRRYGPSVRDTAREVGAGWALAPRPRRRAPITIATAPAQRNKVPVVCSDLGTRQACPDGASTKTASKLNCIPTSSHPAARTLLTDVATPAALIASPDI